MTREEFDIITNKIGCWFTHLKLNSFRKTFDGEVYPSSALGTDYDLFIHKLEKELLFEDNHSLPSDLDEAAEEYGQKEYSHAIHFWDEGLSKNKPEVMKKDFVDSFKAGAKWDAGQGVSMLGRVGIYGVDVESITKELREAGFNLGEEIILQIRKK